MFQISLKRDEKLKSRIEEVISKHKLATILLTGVIVRFVLMPISAHPFDMYVWYAASISVVKNGPLSVQSFPPVQGYILLVPLAYFYNWIVHTFSIGWLGPTSMSSIPQSLNFYPSFNVLYIPGFLFDFITKLPLLLSDVFATILLYKIVTSLTNNKSLGEKASFLWFFNPFLIWVSAVWGMWDTIAALFSLACFYFLLKRKFVFSSICLSIAVLLKVYPLLFLVPIGIFLYKSSFKEARMKNSLKFFSIFFAATFLLIIPYLGNVTSVISGILAPNPVTSGSTTNPVSNPIAYGLTYWSVFLVIRLTNFQITSSLVSLVSLVSVLLVVFVLLATYWKTTKLTFQKPAYDLALVLLLPILAFFLTFRIINEQWFVWSLPFLVIVSVGGRIKGIFYWGTSLFALLYTVLNCPLPFYFLPLAPWYTNTLVASAHFALSNETLRVVLLIVSGCAFSILVTFTFSKLFKIR